MRTTTRLAAVRAAAAAGALAVGLAGLGATASAVDTLANIDDAKAAQATLTIHKHVKPAPGTTPGHPTGDKPQTASDPVEGVVFTAYKINNLDLSNQDNWENLAKHASTPLNSSVCDGTVVGAGLPGGLTVDTAKPIVFDKTSTAGEATKQLGLGAFLICETDTSGAKVKNADVRVIDKALPFIVALPYPNSKAAQGTASDWIYDVHSFPKNTVVNKPSKNVKVTEASHGLGTADQVTYTIDAVVPDVDDASENFKYFTIYDQLPKGASHVKISSVQIGTGVGGDGTLTAAQDVPADKYVKTVDEDTRFARVDFNQATQLTYLESVPGQTIRVTITAQQDNLSEAGTAENTGYLLVDTETKPYDPGNPPTVDEPPTGDGVPPLTPPQGDTPPKTTGDVPPLPTNKVVTTWGEVKVTKKDKASENLLKGATFQVFNAVEPYAQDCSNAVKSGDAISVLTKDSFTSDEHGVVTIPGLFVDEEKGTGDDAPTPDHNQRCYVLVETAAPAGYVLPDDTAAHTPITVVAGAAGDAGGNNHIVITNTKTAVPALPLTGASGQVLMMAGGAALVLLSAGTVLVARRREAQD
ncbi:SpaH/EbpB family LPXTG-anchored major pilin [Actinomyces weissii]|uniref:SpaH/EbpB family LPXTG-anchored major pilin n=1 Tax=Actinomyces weissii TaxID=675090 RepID=A0A7T7MA60_9ACTO|nr:SpaH/EbpB family LPXTG-anchored major pilin [Actinomyces weissii]QQM67743.1 SpaH/EbpB family LPXTG-anchored major pilin [Actinomyces weissii]